MSYEEGKLFDFEKVFFEERIMLDFIELSQIAEIALAPGGQIYEHTQWCHEITYITSGEGFFYTNDKAMQVKSGDIHVVSKDDLHKIIASPHGILRYICLGFDFLDVSKKFEEMCRFYGTSPEFVMPSDGDLRYLFDMVINEFYKKREMQECSVENIIKLILIKVFRLFEKKMNVMHNENIREHRNTTVYKIVRYVDTNIYSVKTVREIAAALNFSENYISHIFKVNMGITLTAYIKKKKIEVAKSLVENQNMTLNEISEILKFDSVYSFNRAFKQECGKTPTQYLAENNKKFD